MADINYIQGITGRLTELLGMQDEELLRFYTLLVLTTGVNTTLKDVHNAWAAWKDAINPNHKSLIWFDLLTAEVQELDRKYMDAIRQVAEKL